MTLYKTHRWVQKIGVTSAQHQIENFTGVTLKNKDSFYTLEAFTKILHRSYGFIYTLQNRKTNQHSDCYCYIKLSVFIHNNLLHQFAPSMKKEKDRSRISTFVQLRPQLLFYRQDSYFITRPHTGGGRHFVHMKCKNFTKANLYKLTAAT